MKIKSIIAFILCLFVLESYAQENEENKTLLVINSTDIPLSFSELEKNQTVKIILKAVTRVKDYQVMLGSFDQSLKVKYPIHLVLLKVVEIKPTFFSIEAFLFNETAKKLIHKVVASEVDKMSFFRELERVMKELFIPVESTGERPKELQSKKYDKKAGLQAISSEATAQINFRDRIMNLKGDVEEQITQIKEDKILQLKIESGAEVKEENKVEAVVKKPDLELAEVPIATLEVKKKEKLVFETSHKVGLFIMQAQTNYKDLIIDTSTQATYAGISYDYMRQVKPGRPYFYKGLLRLGKVMNATAVEFAPYVNVNGGLGYVWGKNDKMLSFGGIEIDSLNFSNIVKVGKNLIPANNRIGSLRIAHDVIISPSFKVGAYLAKAFYVSSDNLWVKDSKIAGNKYGAQVCFADVYKRINIEGEIFISSYTYKADVFDLNTSTKGFGLNAHFIF